MAHLLLSSHIDQTFVKVGNAAEVKVHADFCSFAFGFLLSQVEYFVVVAWM